MAEDVDVDGALQTLRSALAIEPSAELETRVRARLAARRSRRRGIRVVVLATAAAALLALAITIARRAPSAPATVQVVRAPGPPRTAPLLPAPGARPPLDPRAVHAVSNRPHPAAPAVRILVPRDGMARLARYAASVREHPLAPDALSRDASTPLGEPTALEFRAIEITPLVVEGGSRE